MVCKDHKGLVDEITSMKKDVKDSKEMGDSNNTWIKILSFLVLGGFITDRTIGTPTHVHILWLLTFGMAVLTGGYIYIQWKKLHNKKR